MTEQNHRQDRWELARKRAQQLAERMATECLDASQHCEAVGCWLYCQFETKPAASTLNWLKANSFRWSRKHNRWYNCNGFRTQRTNKTYQQITEKYGAFRLA